MADAIRELRGPDGLASDIIVEVKTKPVEPQDGRQCGLPTEGTVKIET